MGKGKLALIIVCSFFGVVLLYALICSGITFIPMLKMSKANKSSVGVAAEPSETIVLENGVNLYAFPHDGIKDKYVLVCPGGGYTSCELQTEGFPIAAELNKLGYTAFVLEYRTGKKITTPQAPLDDLANAIAYIDENANRFNVYAGYYVLCGFSAGGNLIGLFGTEEYGYSNYEDISAPNALIMGYPWCNPSEPSFNGNLADYIFYASLNGNGAKAFLGSKKSYDGMQVPMWVTENYPRTYIMHGTKDTVAPKKDHSDYLVAALEDNNIEYKYNVCENVYHGCGLGLGTAAEGWLSDAMAFSCEHWYEEDYLADPLTPEELTQKAGGFLCGVCHPQERYDQLEDLGSEWVRFDIPTLPFDVNGKPSQSYLDFKEYAKTYVDRGFKIFAVTPTPRLLVNTGFDPRIEENLPVIMAQLRYMVEDLQGLCAAFQVMNEQTETLFREPLTMEESAAFMGMSLRVLNRYKKDMIVGYNLSGNNFMEYLNLLKDYNQYSDYVGVDIYLGCFESTTHSLGFMPATAWMLYVNAFTHRPVVLTEFGYISAGERKTEEEKLEILRLYGAQGDTYAEAEQYAREHITEFVDNQNFPPALRSWMRTISGSEEELANLIFGGPGIAVDYSAHLYRELGENVNVKGYPHTPEGQAKFFTDFFNKVVYNCNYLCGVFMYCLNDAPYCGYCHQDDCPVETRWGLLTENGEKKLSFYAIQEAFEKCKEK